MLDVSLFDELVDYQPPRPDVDHEWDATKKRWVLSAAATARQNATRVAEARLRELDGQERTLLRRLVLDPTDSAARAALAAIDAEVAGLNKTIALG